jgi:hypothetical protein
MAKEAMISSFILLKNNRNMVFVNNFIFFISRHGVVLCSRHLNFAINVPDAVKGLISVGRKESQGLGFIGFVEFIEFLG